MLRFAFFALVLLLTFPVKAAETTDKVYNRIMETGTIRCGYFNYAPAFMTDPNTGERSGIIYDYFEQLANALDLKIEWTQEISLSTFVQDLNTGRYDLECAGGWPNATRGKRLIYSTPIFFAPVYAYARADDLRFDSNYDRINSPETRMAVLEGEYTQTLLNRRFERTTPVVLPQGAQGAELIATVLTGKADLLMTDRGTFLDFDKKNPDKLRQVKGEPVSITTFNISIPMGEFRLQQMLDTATRELLSDGVIDRILKKYDPSSAVYLRVSRPYAIPQE